MTTFKDGWLYFWRAISLAETFWAWMGFVIANGAFWVLSNLTGDLLKALWNAA